jgi:hypothetical protein
MLNLIVRNTHPTQEPAGLEAHRAAKDKAGCVSAIETVITPALLDSFESTATSSILTAAIVMATNCIEAYPTTGCLFSLAGKIRQYI